MPHPEVHNKEVSISSVRQFKIEVDIIWMHYYQLIKSSIFKDSGYQSFFLSQIHIKDGKKLDMVGFVDNRTSTD